MASRALSRLKTFSLRVPSFRVAGASRVLSSASGHHKDDVAIVNPDKLTKPLLRKEGN